jgi:hypothetical protein
MYESPNSVPGVTVATAEVETAMAESEAKRETDMTELLLGR